ncbi:MAG: hypothetical protein LH610_08350 [Sphingomonas bacterium]|nr:hypothetical protein [Sphingomonas bacterium]
MSDFEFIFALFGLLLGLSLTEILAGLARAIDVRLRPGSTARIGWLTPMLGLFVMLDLLSFWQAAWVSRNVVAVSGDSLMAVTAFAGAYYLAASLVFPRVADSQADFDQHFFRVRRIIIGVMLALLVCQLGWYWSMPELSVRLANPLALGLTLILAALMIAAMFVRGERWSRVAMGALIARYIVVYLL